MLLFKTNSIGFGIYLSCVVMKSNSVISVKLIANLWVAIFAFFFIGIYGGFINAGIGFIIMLFLHYFNKMSLIRVNATKVSLVFVYTIGAVIMFALNDKIDWMVGLILAIGNASGAWVGSRWSVKKGDGVIKAAMVIMVCLMSLKLWFF